MKKAYVSPSLEISLFETQDILNVSNAGGLIVTPPSQGGGTEVDGGIELGW